MGFSGIVHGVRRKRAGDPDPASSKPAAAAPPPAPAAPAGNPFDQLHAHLAHQEVLKEFPEVGQHGSEAHRKFHHAMKATGTHPRHALKIARVVLRRSR